MHLITQSAQACKSLREDAYRVILVNANQAIVMTDPDLADAICIEPIHLEVISKIIEKECHNVILHRIGWLTALNYALKLEYKGL